MKSARRMTTGAHSRIIPRRPRLWFDANRESLGSLASFTDLSGYGHHATQATPSSRPVITAGASPLNGRQGLLFDGNDDVLNLSSSTFGTSGHTSFIAFMPLATGGAGFPSTQLRDSFTHVNASPLSGANYAMGFGDARTGKWLNNAYASTGTGRSGLYDTVTSASEAAEVYATVVNTTDGTNFTDGFLWMMVQNAPGPADTPTGTWTTTGKGYALNVHAQTNRVLVVKRKNTIQSSLLSVTPPAGVISIGDKWLMRYTGSTLEVWLQRSGYNGGAWTKQDSIAESEFTTGKFGIETTLSTLATLDDWGYGAISPTASLLAEGVTSGAALKLSTSKIGWLNGGVNQVAASVLSLDAPNIYTFSAASTSLDFKRQSIADGGGATYGAFTPDRIGQNFSGFIFEIICYDRLLNAAEQLQVENYLKTKWAIGTTSPVGSGLGIRPFRHDSPWNVDISAAPVDPNSSALVSALSSNSIIKSSQAGFASNPDVYALPIYDIPPGQSLTSVYVNGAYTNCLADGVMVRTNSYLDVINFPMPIGWQSDEAGDNNTELIDWNTGDEWGFHDFKNAEGKVSTTAALSIGDTTLSIVTVKRNYFVPGQTNVVLDRGLASEETVQISTSWDRLTVPIPLQAAVTKAHASGAPISGAFAGNTFHYNIYWSGIPPDKGINGPSQGFANSGAGSPYLTGIFRAWEVAHGSIPHAIGCDLSDGFSSYVSPATRSDQGPAKTIGAGGWATSQPAGTSLLVATTTGFNYSLPVVGTQIIIGAGTANEEILTVASIPDVTHYTFTTATTKPHAAGEMVFGYGAVSMGRRYRLKASYDTSALTGSAKVVAEAAKRYGIIFRDGGGHFKLTPEGTFSGYWNQAGNPTLSDAILSVIPLSQLELLA